MNQKYSEKLFDTFPEIFDRQLLAGRIACQDGWYRLLAEFSVQALRLQKCGAAGDLRVHGLGVEGGHLRIRHRGEPSFAGLVHHFEQRATTLCELDGAAAAGLFACRPHWRRYLCNRCADLHELMMVKEARPVQPAADERADGRVLALCAAA